jgi:pimeloyl-ACP methyl ester carboxylesterase
VNLPEPSWATAAGHRIAYVDLGEGPPVLLLHGFPTSCFLWRRVAWLLAQRMRVIAPDLLGYGASDRPAGADLSEPAQAAYVRELLQGLGVGRLAVVGHDIGGAIGQLLALDASELDISALVLVDAPSLDARPAEAVRRLQRASPGEATAPFVEDAVRRFLDQGMGHRERLTAEDIRGYLAPWLADPPSVLRAAGGVTGGGLAGREEDLARLQQAALLVWGEDDPLVPAEIGERLNELLPGSSLALLPGCSHLVTEDAAQTVGPLVYEYLRSRYVGDAHGHGAAAGPVPVFLQRPPAAFFDEGSDDEED